MLLLIQSTYPPAEVPGVSIACFQLLDALPTYLCFAGDVHGKNGILPLIVDDRFNIATATPHLKFFTSITNARF